MEEEIVTRTTPRRRAVAAAAAAGLLAAGAWVWSTSDASAGEGGAKGGKRSVQHDDHRCPGKNGRSGDISV